MVHNAGQYVGITSDNADGLTAGMLGFGDGSMLSADGGSTNLATMRYYQRLYGDAYIDLMERGRTELIGGQTELQRLKAEDSINIVVYTFRIRKTKITYLCLEWLFYLRNYLEKFRCI